MKLQFSKKPSSVPKKVLSPEALKVMSCMSKKQQLKTVCVLLCKAQVSKQLNYISIFFWVPFSSGSSLMWSWFMLN